VSEQWYCPNCGYKDADTVYCSCGEMLDRYPLPPFVTAMREEIAALETSLQERWENLNVQDGVIDGLNERIAALEKVAADIAQLVHDAPELNMGNYDDDQVCELNNAMIAIYLALREAGYLGGGE
jgi:hypothetical protein